VPNILVAHPSFPAKTVAEIIKMAKAKPGVLTHGTSSIGSASFFNMVLFKQMAGIDMVQVSYPGDGPALIALLGGHVPFAFNNAVAAMTHIQSGRLRPIAVSSPARMASLPEVPTMVESGLTGYEALLFYCLVAPARTPPDIIKKLHEPNVKQQFERLGAVNFDMSSAELGAFIQRDLDKWTKVIRAAGIKPE
jgi:tripartite-type tricarboxylate transporter receptor subunit TctC